jgi:hypothetical protein
MFKVFSRISSQISSLLKILETIDEGMESSPQEAQKHEAGYEKRDVNVFALAMTGVALVIGGIFLQLILTYGFFYLKRTQGTEITSQTPKQPPADFLKSSDPNKELADYQDEMHQILNSYGWVDRKAGIVRIPIHQAMRKLSHEK